MCSDDIKERFIFSGMSESPSLWLGKRGQTWLWNAFGYGDTLFSPLANLVRNTSAISHLQRLMPKLFTRPRAIQEAFDIPGLGVVQASMCQIVWGTYTSPSSPVDALVLLGLRTIVLDSSLTHCQLIFHSVCYKLVATPRTPMPHALHLCTWHSWKHFAILSSHSLPSLLSLSLRTLLLWKHLSCYQGADHVEPLY